MQGAFTAFTQLVLRPLEKVPIEHFQKEMFWAILDYGSSSHPDQGQAAGPGSDRFAVGRWRSAGAGRLSRFGSAATGGWGDGPAGSPNTAPDGQSRSPDRP